jgi:hypothetical protein
VSGEACDWCGVPAPEPAWLVDTPDPTGGVFKYTGRSWLRRPSCAVCENLPHETSFINRLGGGEALDLLVCQVVGLRWEVGLREVAVKLGLTTWSEHVAAHPDAPPVSRPFGWWPSLAEMCATAWPIYGLHQGESTAYALTRWASPVAYSRARDAYAVSQGRERRPAAVTT